MSPAVLLIVSPGFERTAFLPLERALVAEGCRVHTLEFPIAGQGTADYVDAIAAAAPGTIVVAHGIGATLALIAAPRVDADRYVLLAPILDVVPLPLHQELARRPAGAVVDLRAGPPWRDRDPAAVLTGRPSDLGLVPGRFAAEVQGWIHAGAVPLDLPAIDDPVWLAVGLADEVATVEAVVPASRALPRRHLVRLGANRFDPRDYTHGDLLVDPVPVGVAVRAVTTDRWIRHLPDSE